MLTDPTGPLPGVLADLPLAPSLTWVLESHVELIPWEAVGNAGAERVEAIPDTMVCVTCAGEMGGSEFLVVVVPEKTSKEGSLKKNYGGYGTRKIRKPFRPKGP